MLTDTDRRFAAAVVDVLSALQATAESGWTRPPSPAAQAYAGKIPPAWCSEARAAIWRTLTPEVQRVIAEHEAEVHREFTRFDEERLFGRRLREAIAPYMPLIEAGGSDPLQTVRALLDTAFVLRAGTMEQKRAGLLWIAETFGIPFEQDGTV